MKKIKKNELGAKNSNSGAKKVTKDANYRSVGFHQLSMDELIACFSKK